MWGSEVESGMRMFGFDEENTAQVPTQAQSLVEGSSTVVVSEYKPIPDLDYLQVNCLGISFHAMHRIISSEELTFFKFFWMIFGKF